MAGLDPHGHSLRGPLSDMPKGSLLTAASLGSSMLLRLSPPATMSASPPSVLTQLEVSVANEVAEQRSQALILMDVRFAGPLSGIETARRIWQRLRIAILCCSAHADVAMLKAVQTAERHGYVVKPQAAGSPRGSVREPNPVGRGKDQAWRAHPKWVAGVPWTRVVSLRALERDAGAERFAQSGEHHRRLSAGARDSES